MKYHMVFDYRSSKFKKILAFLLIFSLTFQFNGCYYYKAVIPANEPILTIQNEMDGSYMMLHSGEDVKIMRNIQIFDDHITCNLGEVVGHDYYKDTNLGRATRYRMKASVNESEVLNEVHVYASSFEMNENQEATILIEKISNVVLYDPATQATVASWVLLNPGTILTASFLLLLLTSCPFVYTFNGDHYTFSGEIYSGSLFPQLERDDYLRLNDLEPYEDNYHLVMSNEIKEIQHTNLAELLYVDHSLNDEVLLDKYGQLQTISEAVVPQNIKNLKGSDIRRELTEKDNLVYFGADLNVDPDILDGVILETNLPEMTHEIKLLLSARNSFWLEYVYHSFHELLGSRYGEYSNRNAESSRENLHDLMLKQHLPVSVYLERDGEWNFVDYFNIAGPMAFREDVLSIDVSDFAKGPLKIKLEYGTYFWELDYVAIDYSANVPLEMKKIPLGTAINEKGLDVGLLLNADDDEYYVQPDIGNLAKITFPVPELNDEARSIFLHSKGHYKILRDPKGLPDAKKLKSLKEGDGLPQYSRELLLELNNN